MEDKDLPEKQPPSEITKVIVDEIMFAPCPRFPNCPRCAKKHVRKENESKFIPN